MLKRALILFVLALVQTGCSSDEGGTMVPPRRSHAGGPGRY